MLRRSFLVFLGGLVGTLLSLGLHPLPLPFVGVQPSTILVAAPASLADALEEIDPLFESANPSVRVSYNFAASGSLQQQIEQGARVDVFISAASRQMDALQGKGFIVANSRRNLLINSLVLVVPTNSPLDVSGFRQLIHPKVDRIAVGEPRSVPAGHYAEELFRNLGLLEQLRPKFVYSNSVRNVLAAVESGNADAGAVYATDAKVSNRVRQVATAPSNLHSPIVYPIAMVAASRRQQAGRTYLQFLTSAQAQAVFRRYGFGLG